MTRLDGTGRPKAKLQSERQRHPTEVRRQLLIEAARDLIADKGLINVEVRDISLACALSPATITYHFRNLEEVLWAAVKAETADFYVPGRRAVDLGRPGKGPHRCQVCRAFARALFTVESRQHPRRRRSRHPDTRTRPFRSPHCHPRSEGRCSRSCRWFPIGDRNGFPMRSYAA